MSYSNRRMKTFIRKYILGYTIAQYDVENYGIEYAKHYFNNHNTFDDFYHQGYRDLLNGVEMRYTYMSLEDDK